MIEFFIPMQLPTVTHQEQRTGIRNGKPFRYDPPELKAARVKFRDSLAAHAPEQSFTGGVRLCTKWCFPRGAHADGEYRITKPDTDNLVKLLKDVMTELHFWNDDAQVASEIIEKFWAEMPGLYVAVEALP